jgi:hypothetical protein
MRIEQLIHASALFVLLMPSLALSQDGQVRRAASKAELRGWLENMHWHHRYSDAEIGQVLGLTVDDVAEKLAEFEISDDNRPARPVSKMFVLPYPGGRHPRIGFLDGAVEPQRETKLSVFCPWDETSYAVLDLPEAVWSNLGLTYLAHTHVDTIWTKQGITLEQQEWTVTEQGDFELIRKLPNGIELGVKVVRMKDHLRMKMWLTNGTAEPLSGLRVQNCVMLKGMAGFDQQTNENKLFQDGFAVASSPNKARWIISAWDPVQRAWGNAPCPCLHSDPQFADCAPGETQWLRGWFSFYEGDDIDSELQRIDATGWRTHPLHHVTGNLVGKVVDADTGKPLPCRLYVQNLQDSQFYFARSTAVEGSALGYDRQLGNTPSVEKHTTLSADGFQLDVPPGRYRIRAQLGKEYLPSETTVDVGDARLTTTLKLQRYANAAKNGWYSGDTHVHRPAQEMSNLMLAEDLNVAFPLQYWVRDSQQVPALTGDEIAAEPITIDATHIYYPVNTEYEIFTIAGKRHTQGAVFVLNHTRPLELTAPPVRKLAVEARRQHALLDLDKHSWNWSVMIVPLMKVDLFELSNNHHWQTQFGFPAWTLENAPPDWPEIETNQAGFTEAGWTEFGLQTYYAFLNCGYRMRVTAGTGAGVHPVALGHGRVYVHCGEKFDYATWIENLNRGHSYVTQGPLLDIRFNGELPGTTWSRSPTEDVMKITGSVQSIRPLTRVEVVHNGEVQLISEKHLAAVVQPDTHTLLTKIEYEIPVSSSGWIALRCFEQPETSAPDEKIIFAHTNPVFVDVPGKPLKPRVRDVEYFVERMTIELKRNQDVISDEALAEYAEAKTIYEALLQTAQPPTVVPQP